MSEVSAADGEAGAARAGNEPGAARADRGSAGTRAAGAIRPAAVAALPAEPGVYRFRDQRDRVLYVGRAVNLRRRVASYWGDLGSRRHLAPMVARIARVQALVCDSEHEAAWLERNLLERGLPRWNRTPGGQEVPVYVRLDLRPRFPGLTVVHEACPSPDALYFGPYLGGLRVRLAASAVHRVMPVAYAADGLRGTLRDLAGVRGVDPGDRAALIDAITALFDREPDAVAALRAELLRRRDGAATELAFELAARLQAEIQAVDWVTSEQKVTCPDPGDADVHGWASRADGDEGGVLVSLGIRGGRLNSWRQRSWGSQAAGRLVAGTPPEWRRFAQRNAELAARLG
ncbi:MAG TPA: GIY-YIG nuclease family protein [Streptosporangiaceae bacterium]|nr:GIY-YIG nuclease family protein [Streptosporangiaceae bacterium]